MASRYYEDEINQLTQDLANRKFEYNQEEDPLYQAYKKQYETQGQKAMENTLAQVSARTGGLANSYAGIAAQQTYQDYMDQLNAKALDLYQLALNKYNNETNAMQDQLGNYQSLGATNYNRDVDDRNYYYQLGRDQIEDARYDTEWAYQLAQDKAKAASSSGSGSGSDVSRLKAIAESTGNVQDIAEYLKATGQDKWQVANSLQNLGYEKVTTSGELDDYEPLTSGVVYDKTRWQLASESEEAKQAAAEKEQNTAMQAAYEAGVKMNLTEDELFEYIQAAGISSGASDDAITEFCVKRNI